MANTVTTPTYLELISKDEKAVKLESLKLKAQEAALELNREIFNLTSKIQSKKNELATAQRAIPYSVAVEYKISQDIANTQTQLEFAQAVRTERFADATI